MVGKKCVKCPSNQPYYNNYSCNECPTSTFWNASSGTCVECPGGRILNTATELCECPTDRFWTGETCI